MKYSIYMAQIEPDPAEWYIVGLQIIEYKEFNNQEEADEYCRKNSKEVYNTELELVEGTLKALPTCLPIWEVMKSL
jgi:viroplasmin and RNaseH domain-containing protein